MLYLSLEDTQRRIKDRLYNLTDSAPDNLYFAVTSGLIGGGLEEQITDFLTEHPATKLVIIDTLQKVRDSKGSTGKAGMYGNDYDDISSIKRIADGFNIAILLVHHLRKLQDSDDPFNDVSGSTGIIGAADTNFILRRKRSGNAATLLVSGRDVEYQELTLQFNDLVWELVERKNSEDIPTITLANKILESNINPSGITFEISRVKIITDGNKTGVVKRKYPLNKIAGFNAVTSKSGKVFYNNTVDLSGLNHC